MFIELTDHLRCAGDHEEAYLVLLPGRMEGRVVREGELDCPVCGVVVALAEGIVDFGAPPPDPAGTALSAEAIHALLGLSGPGGFVALAGPAGALAEQLAPRLAGVHLVAVNPPAELVPSEAVSVVRSPRWPLKAGCLRGAVLAGDPDPALVRDAVRATLPGLRVVGEGPPPETGGLELLASTAGVWVGTRR